MSDDPFERFKVVKKPISARAELLNWARGEAHKAGMPVMDFNGLAIRHFVSLPDWKKRVEPYFLGRRMPGKTETTEVQLSKGERAAVWHFLTANQVNQSVLMNLSFEAFRQYLEDYRKQFGSRARGAPELEPVQLRSVQGGSMRVLEPSQVKELQEIKELADLRHAIPWITRDESGLTCERCEHRLTTTPGAPLDLVVMIELGFRKVHQQTCGKQDEVLASLPEKRRRKGK